MKRPRRPTKKTVRKKTVKRSTRAPAPRQPEQLTPAQAAIFERPKPRKGFSYQWAHVDQIDEMLAAGWCQVHYSRHPEMPRATSFAGFIVYKKNMLFETAASIVDDNHRTAKDAANAQIDSFYRQYGLTNHCHGRHRRMMEILSPHFIVSSDYDGVLATAPPLAVPLTLQVMIPARWQDAAAALRLDPAEYARRRIVMMGQTITPSPDGTFSLKTEEED